MQIMNARVSGTRLILAVFLAVFSSGCLEHEVKTTINSDGSCDRVVVLKPAGRSVPDTPFPLPMDQSWDTTWTKTDSGKSEYVYTMKKHFESFDALEKEYASDMKPGKIEVRVQVRKKFRWFYTYFDYRESYGRYTPYTLVPPSAVMTEEEIHSYTYGDTNRTLENKKNEWVARNLFEVLHRSILRGARALDDSTLKPEILSARKEGFFRMLTGLRGPGEPIMDPSKNPALTAYRGLEELFKKDSITDAGIDGFVRLASDAYGNPALRKIGDSIRVGWKEATRLMHDGEHHGEKFASSVEMPGLLLGTNASKVEGNSAAWNFEIESLSLLPYEMHAESRIVNVWAIWVTGMAGLMILAILLLPLFLRDRHPFRGRVPQTPV